MPYIVPEDVQIAVIPPRYPSEAPKVMWTSATGVETDLSTGFGGSNGIFVRPGAIGLGMPEIEYHTSGSPNFDGEIVSGFRLEPRDIDLPIHMWAENRDELVAKWHRLVADMKPVRGKIGFLTITDRHGASRSIQAYYKGGLQGQDDNRTWRMRDITTAITLYCPSPLWEGEEFSYDFELEDTTRKFFPILPVVVSNSRLLGDLTVDNDGDAETYPIFTIQGPCDSLTFRNVTTGKVMSLAGGLASTSTMVIDTRENFGTVLATDNAGVVTNRFGNFTGTLWSLQEAENELSLVMPGATGASKLTISGKLRYLTGY